MKLNRDLMEAIFSRQAILFVGAGVSRAYGYPSWIEMLENLWHRVGDEGYALEGDRLEQYKIKGNLPEAFDYIESVIGREHMVKLIKKDFYAKTPNNKSVYDIVTKWPFSCYCTTNYDHEIIKHLVKKNKQFLEVGNKNDDFSNIHASMKNFVFQLHGNLETDNVAIITQSDYDKLVADVNFNYYQEGLKALFRMRKCIFIGYSCEDEDIKLILRIVRSCINSKNKNTYIFLADASDDKIIELTNRFSLTVINYHTRLGAHDELLSYLAMMDRFMSGAKAPPITHTQDSEKAISLYLCGTMYRNRRNVDFSNYILLNMRCDGNGEELDALAGRLHVTGAEIRSGVQMLLDANMVEKVGSTEIKLTQEGEERIKKCQNVLRKQKDVAYSDFLKAMGVSDKDGSRFVKLAEEVLIQIFQKRGYNLTQNIFKQTYFTSGGLLDVYGILAKYASQISDTKKMLDFVNAIHEFVITPTEFQKAYLTGLSQGYFLYYLIGSDARTADIRKKIFEKTTWYVDSNVLIPLLAKGCYLNGYSSKLFALLKKLKTNLVVTPGVLEEVKWHLEWAKKHIIDKKVEEWMRYATLEAGNNLNLFIDGYIHERASGQVASFESYCHAIESQLREDGKKIVSAYGLALQKPDEINTKRAQEEFDKIFAEIKSIRDCANTYKNDHQVRTEAEIAYLANKRLVSAALLNADTYVYFLSQSPILSKIEKKICVWTSEALFRYAEAISARENAGDDDELFHACLLGEAFAAGEAFIDKEMYEAFFKEEIDAATRTFKEEVPLYVEYLEAGVNEEEMEGNFMQLPPLERPSAVKRLSIHLRQSLGKVEQSHKDEIAEKEQVIKAQENEIKEYQKEMTNGILKHREEIAMRDEENARLKEDNEKKDRSIRALEATVRNLRSKKEKKSKLKKQIRGRK